MTCVGKGLFVSAILLGLLAGAGPAAATDLGPGKVAEPPRPPSQWKFSFTPYGWLINIDADAMAAGHTIAIDKSFFEIVEDTDSLWALMGYFEVRKGRFAMFTDVVWYDLTLDGQRQFAGSRNERLNPFARLPNFDVIVKANLDARGKADVEYQSTIVTSGLAYEIAQWNSPTSSTALDVLGGARYWNNETDVTLHLSGEVSVDVAAQFRSLGLNVKRSGKGSRAVAGSIDLEWVDPFVGLQLRHRMGKSQELRLEGDVGGFGVGSDFSWGAVATYGFDVNCFGRPIHTVVGYRALFADYSENGKFGRNGLDGTQHGPVMGATMRW